MMRYWTGVASAFGLGALVGAVAVRVALEQKMREEYDEKAKALERVFNLTYNIWPENVEAPAETEEELLEKDEPFTDWVENVISTPGAIVVDIAPQAEPVQNAYHKAISAVETPVELFVEGGVNDYGISYIEEDDFFEDDGRYKGQIDILMDDHNPVFIMDGNQIDDWDKRVGDSILIDFYKLVPPGVEPVLYVRNHRTEEDYQVVRVVP